MSILVDEDTRLIVQGITGKQGCIHTKYMLEYGTKIVAGVTPGKGGENVHGIPVYDTIEEALEEHNANASICFVPAKLAKSAVMEAIECKLDPIVVITEHIPVHDTMELIRYAEEEDVRLIGPNTPGVISPGKCKVGIMPGQIFSEGDIGVVSRSGTLTYEIANHLTRSGLGQSTCVGIGGDPINGTGFIEILKEFEKDDQTEKIVIVGEIGGSAEEEAAEYIKKHVSKSVVAYIAGRFAPKGKRMGHAGAIVEGERGTAESKINAFREAGVDVADFFYEIPNILKRI